jgi:hypothetical protein
MVAVFNLVNSQFWLDGVLRQTGNTGPAGTYADLTYLSVGNYYTAGYGWIGPIGHAIYFAGVPADIPGMSAGLKRVWGTV